MRDTGKSKVYAAEAAVFEETLYDEAIGMSGIASLTDHLFTDDWWVTSINRYPEVVATRREANRSYAQADRSGHGKLAFCVGQETVAVLSHEASHIATCARHPGSDIASHGPEFRATMVDVTNLLCGVVAAARLAQSYREHGLEIGTRAEPAPPVRHERGIYGLWRLDRLGSANVT